MRILRSAWRLLDDYRRVAQGYGTSLRFVLWRGASLVRRRGFRFREVLQEGLLDPSVPAEVLAAAIGKKGLTSLQRSVNTPERECLTEDKALFYSYCKGLGLPVPELYAVFGRYAGYAPSGRALVGREAWAAFLADELPEECVLKPAFGYCGVGVRLLRRVGGELLDQDGMSLAPAALYDQLASGQTEHVAGQTFRKFVFQERLSPHPELARLSGTSAVQTARIVTIVESGRVELNHAFLRVVTGCNVVDNYRHGETGNLEAPLDLLEGCLREAWGPHDGVGCTRVTHHPTTAVPLAGFRLPFWEAAKALVEKAAILFLPMRCIGWDVAITPSGPVLLEANMWWGPHNAFAFPSRSGDGLAGLLERLEAAARRGRIDWKG